MFKRRMVFNAPILSGIVCLLFLTFYNDSLWQQLVKYTSVPFILAFAFCVATIIYGLLTLASSKYLYKPLLILAFFMGAVSAYSMDTFGYVISTEAFKNIVETDSHEVFDLLNWRLVRYMIMLFVIPLIAIVFVKVKYPKVKFRSGVFLLCVLLFIGNVVLLHKHYVTLFRNHKEIKYYINPIRPIYSMIKYTYLRFKPGVEKVFVELDSNPIRLTQVGAKPKLVILVVGESDRAMNHALNGYIKQTNPKLSTRNDILSFNKFYSCGTETTVSVPCMFSAFRREDFTDHKGTYTENVLDLLQKSQVEVLWRDNDSGCKNVCDRVTTHDLNNVDIKPYCNDFECHDEVLLHNLDQYINESSGDKLIVLHKKGNHGPAYYRRYPEAFQQFTPICATNELNKCTDQEIINTYDNIILYTDYFLDKVITQLESKNAKYQTALIYVSDHGESLGENGVYLHAMPYWLAPKEQIHVPFIFWASKDFAIDHARLAAISQQEFSHDHLFHSLLGIFKVQSVVYAQELDIFAAG